MDHLSDTRNTPGRRKKELQIKERNISGDEFMAASIGDVVWLDQTLKENEGKPSGFDRNGLAPIHLAALHGRLNCLQLLIEKYDDDVNLKSTTGWTALHLSINKEIGAKAAKCMNYLLSKGAEIDEFNDDDVSAIHQAASEGLYDCLKVLVVDVDLDLLLQKDCRGYTALDLARIWGHKRCVRLLKNEIWKREKEKRAIEVDQLNHVKKLFSDLQRDAVYQLRNEQDFYGSVAFGNWLADKGLPEQLRHVAVTHIERYPNVSIDGLVKRLQTSGGLEDCQQRLEKGSVKKSRALQRNRDSDKQTDKHGVSTRRKLEKSTKQAAKRPVKEKIVKRVKVEGYSPETSEESDGQYTYSPLSDASQSQADGKPYHRTPWNFSTNVKSKPETNIQNKDYVSMSIHPDEPFMMLPQRANLSVRLATTPETKIRFTVPGGHIKSAGIRMPRLPKKFVAETLSGEANDRIRIPQEFKAVHVYDLQKKRTGEKPDEEAGMHIQMFGHKKFARRSAIIGPDMPINYISESDLGDIFPPLTRKQGFTRVLDTIKGMNSPRAFLA